MMFTATLKVNEQIQEVAGAGRTFSGQHGCDDYSPRAAKLGTLSLKYPLAFLGFLILGFGYAIYRIIKDRFSSLVTQ